MDSTRRTSRMVIDPKVRQVGFVTPATNNDSQNSTTTPDVHASSSAATTELEVEPPGANSPSPVMIPPPRHTCETRPLPVPAVPSATSTMVMGSYAPSDSLLGTSTPGDDATDRGYYSIPSQDISDDVPDFSNSVSTDVAINPRSEKANVVSSWTADSVLASSFSVSASLPPKTAVPQGQSKAAVDPKSKPDSKSKPLKERTTKAERRAQQEAQRAAKAATKDPFGGKKGVDGGITSSSKETNVPKSALQRRDSATDKKVSASDKKSIERGSEKDKKKDVPTVRMQFDDEQRVAKAKKRSLVEQTEAKHRVELFRHLPQFVHGTQLPALEAKFFQNDPMHPHPSVYKVGLQFLNGDIVGGNARCFAMLSAFQDAIKDYNTPPEKTFVRDLTAKINSYISFLITCRPLSVSMGNAIKFLKARIAKLSVTLSESEAKSSLVSDIDRFIHEKIIFADKVIVDHAVSKISNGDVLLTYGLSCVIVMILLRAHELGKQFHVFVVDSRPKLEGLEMLRRLLAGGLKCTYTHINAVSFVINDVTKVLLGAASVLSNGTVYSRVGTACVAMVAHASHVPVLVCCEAYKFHERVQLDSICFNELGDPDALVKIRGRPDVNELEGWTDNEHLQLLNLTYDATPADYVSMIITDYGMVPPTSVAVIVREYRREYLLI